MQLTAHVKLRRMAPGFPAPLGLRPPRRLDRGRLRKLGVSGRRIRGLVGDTFQVLFERPVALGDPLLVRVVHRDLLLQHK
jgi:hypothetical protein